MGNPPEDPGLWGQGLEGLAYLPVLLTCGSSLPGPKSLVASQPAPAY